MNILILNSLSVSQTKSLLAAQSQMPEKLHKSPDMPSHRAKHSKKRKKSHLHSAYQDVNVLGELSIIIPA